jgi:ribonuclease HII
MRVLGVDEAGRGCVLGALVVGAFCTELTPEALRAAGAADSKALTPARRRAALARLAKLGQPDHRDISAQAIDAGNLNTLEEEAIVALIAAWRPDVVQIDALGHPSTLPATMRRITQSALDRGCRVTVEMTPKADALWPAVGAASIVAKLRRDDLLDALRADHGDFGSGYPSDPTTRAWLTAHAAAAAPWPHFVRTRWGTVRDLAQP